MSSALSSLGAGGLSDIGAGLGGSIGSIINILRDIPGGEESFEEAVDILRAVQEPGFDFTRLTPPQLRLVARFDPTFFEAQVPESVKGATESPVRDRQIAQLDFFERAAQEGLPLESRLAAEAATGEVARENQRVQEAILSNLGARGALGGGQEVQARLLGQQGQVALEAEQGRALAQDAINRQFGAAGTAADLAGDISRDEETLSNIQAQTINRFNELAAGLRQQAARENAQAASAAQAANVQEEQRIAETNALLPFQAALDEKREFNRLQEALFNARFAKAGGVSRGLFTLGGQQEAAKQAEEELIRGTGEGLGRTGGAIGGAFLGGA